MHQQPQTTARPKHQRYVLVRNSTKKGKQYLRGNLYALDIPEEEKWTEHLHLADRFLTTGEGTHNYGRRMLGHSDFHFEKMPE